MLEHIITLIAPHTCLGCYTQGSLLCDRCRRQLPEARRDCYRCHRGAPTSGICAQCQPLTPLASVQAATLYEATAKELVHRLKFERASDAARTMAQCLAERYVGDSDLVITHVPTATNRVRQRGYDQAALMAKHASRLLGVPYVPLLYRTGQVRQLGANRSERLTRMSDAFCARPDTAHIHAKVLLIDDVITTGSTIEAAARTLRRAGITEIAALAYAHA